MLTEFQRSALKTVSAASENRGFALAGGAALILQGLVDRQTRDLDFFARESSAVNETCPIIEAALRSDGIDVSRVVDAPGFIRLEISQHGEKCEVDLGNDARTRPEVNIPPFGNVLAPEELAADKTLALFGRAAARDFVDVFFLAQHFEEDRLCELAREKDSGFDERHFREALQAFGRLDRDLFEVDEKTFRSIRTWTIAWREQLQRQEIERSGPSTELDHIDGLSYYLPDF